MYDNYDRRTRRAVLDIYRDLKKVGKTSKQLIPLPGRRRPALPGRHGARGSLPAGLAADRQRAPSPAQVHILPASGHWPFIDDPPAVTELLTAFLATVE